MPRRTLAATVAAILATAACIDVPDSMRAQFAPAGPTERTNFRPGHHGVVSPPVDVMIPDASAPDADLDAAPANVAEGGQV